MLRICEEKGNMEMSVSGSVSANRNQLGYTEAYIMKYSWSAKAGTD